jgi:hypothetical protein
MNYSRLGLAALGGMVASFAFGFLVLWLVPALIKEGHKYPAVFRPKEEMMTVMPIGLVATFIAILVVAIIFAMIHQGGSGTTEGARFGVLIGIFVVCAFVLHNYVNFDETLEAEVKRGNDLVLSCELSGKFSGIKVAYLGTQRDLGVVLEIFNGLPEGK